MMVRCDICKVETATNRLRVIDSGDRLCPNCLAQTRSGRIEISQAIESTTKQCSFCKKMIDKDAIVCPYCREQPDKWAVWVKGIGAIITLILIGYLIFALHSCDAAFDEFIDGVGETEISE